MIEFHVLLEIITSLLPFVGAIKRFDWLLRLGSILPPIAYCTHPMYKLFATCAYP
jgi:hypothetical protein